VARCLHEFEDVGVVDVEMENHCPVFVHTTSTELLVKAAIDFSK
jgi:hypothetical protein